MSPQHYQKQYTPLRRPNHRFGNPYFRSRAADRVAMSRVKNSASRISFRIWMYILLFGFLCITLIWLICFSPFLVISQVKVTGAAEQRVEAIEQSVWTQISERRFWFLSQSHVLLFDSESFRNMLLENYVLNDVQIKKKIPKKLEVIVIEKIPVAVWFEGDSYFVIDDQGWVIDTVSGPGEGLATIYNNGQPKLNNKRLEGQESLIKASIELQASLNGRFSYLKPDQITSTHERNTVTVVLKQGTLIYFAIDESISSQLDRLDALVKSELKNKFSQVDYIDLRFGDKVYYK
jgi:cell division septal protein FtsQ